MNRLDKFDHIPRYIVKNCKRCNKEARHAFNSHILKSGKPQYRTVCIECRNLEKANEVKANRKKVTTWTLERKEKLKSKLVEYKGGKCQSCGYNKSKRALTFHHRDPKQKDFSVSQMLYRLKWEVVLAEVDKCDMLCSNCHHELHESLDMLTNKIRKESLK